jgi:uncharacterized protein YjdB
MATVGSGAGVVSGISAGSATISYSLGAGCSTWMLITVNALPPAITGTTHACIGGSATLGDPAPGGTWSSSNTSLATVSATGLVTGVAGGSPIISYTLSTTGCSATASFSVISVPPISGVHNLCAWGDTMTVTDANATGIFSSTFATVLPIWVAGTGRVMVMRPVRLQFIIHCLVVVLLQPHL